MLVLFSEEAGHNHSGCVNSQHNRCWSAENSTLLAECHYMISRLVFGLQLGLLGPFF